MEEDIAVNTEAWINSLAPDGETGYIFEVDLKSTFDTHSSRSEYPLAPEHKSIRGCLLSPYQRGILRVQYLKENPDLTDEQLESKLDSYVVVEKLVTDLADKTKYILHYSLLQLY